MSSARRAPTVSALSNDSRLSRSRCSRNSATSQSTPRRLRNRARKRSYSESSVSMVRRLSPSTVSSFCITTVRSSVAMAMR